MRINGKRVSRFTNDELFLMLRTKEDFAGLRLTHGQIVEIKKTIAHRKDREEGNENGSIQV